MDLGAPSWGVEPIQKKVCAMRAQFFHYSKKKRALLYNISPVSLFNNNIALIRKLIYYIPY